MKSWTVIVGAVALAVGAAQAEAAGRGQAEATLGGKKVSIDYGRPDLQGRDMLEKAPPGFVWRLGSNAPTKLTTEANLAFGNLKVPKGTYSLYAKRVDEKSWALVVNTKLGAAVHDPSADVGSAPLAWTKLEASTETLTIAVDAKDKAATLSIVWGKDRLETPFSPE